MYTKGWTEKERILFLRGYLNCTMYDPGLFPLSWLEGTDFFRAPASTSFHAAYEGGLFDHSLNVADCLIRFQLFGVSQSWKRKDSPVIVGILHDATKIGAYSYVQDMNPSTGDIDCFWIHNPYQKITGVHGEDSVNKIKEHMELTEEEAFCIRWHMGAYEGQQSWSAYDEAIKAYPNVLWTHTADMVASKLIEED